MSGEITCPRCGEICCRLDDSIPWGFARANTAGAVRIEGKRVIIDCCHCGAPFDHCDVLELITVSVERERRKHDNFVRLVGPTLLEWIEIVLNSGKHLGMLGYENGARILLKREVDAAEQRERERADTPTICGPEGE